MLLRKEIAGSDNFGHEWSEDGAVVDVPEHEARQLLTIKDAGFSEVAEVPVTRRVVEAVKKTAVTAKKAPVKGIDVTTFTE